MRVAPGTMITRAVLVAMCCCFIFCGWCLGFPLCLFETIFPLLWLRIPCCDPVFGKRGDRYWVRQLMFAATAASVIGAGALRTLL
jgi:hypothetical protein